MSEKEQVSQPTKDVQEAEVKQTQTDVNQNKTFTQEDVDRIVQTRLGAERVKQ